MLEDAIENQRKVLESLEKNISNFQNVMTKAKESASDSDKIQLENFENDMKRAISLARNGGDVDSLISSLRKQWQQK